MSSKNDIAVSVRGLSKSYSIAHNAAKHTTAGEALMHRLRHPFAREERETFWALDDVSFDIQRGDVVGIIGRNGAGKSTLLKVLSRITEPTAGQIDLYGRVGSLLEVGTGFHAELTGRENIFLNGAILGMSRAEIARQFDAIVDFSGVEQFLDTPVKRYSSGMYVRLAFAVAAHLNPEILIVDEVLAVGDAEFQKKCLGKMQDVAASGRTILFVSHNMQSVSLLCNKGIFLRNGHITYSGGIQGAISTYLSSFVAITKEDRAPEQRPGSGEYRVIYLAPSKDSFISNEEKEFTFRLKHYHGRVGRMFLSFYVYNSAGVIMTHCDSRLIGEWIEDYDFIEGTFGFKTPWLKPGEYRVDVAICSGGVIDGYQTACNFVISPVIPYAYSVSDDGVEHGQVFADFTLSVCPLGGSYARNDQGLLRKQLMPTQSDSASNGETW